ncbi:MAG: HI0074 family nucleotidyltransferase substrate-binding subunit [Cyanobacteriota bacterium]|nr:HI0074 family nucleotidyltransferase substrate-binding subunit [Cyanobacteriota bacterium]MDY6359400.1 HI0074 family nucleotidyltransferase substrate-binding subunit [Cyanobacteriota bacterium]MDY6364104.1 HI0074 family nucleotidyltransferase substrate-binding subunit [Cyanobacteriota bacterium]MDY6383692.1 HI0074 family nucleotidyltransferase substrate-binding subunit [Cyanobacteriota bacterium]
MQNIDLTSFEKAICSLNSILERYKRDNYDIDIRDAVIQRFEYTYSLAVKMMKRYISSQMPEIPTDLTFNEIIRQANKFGLLKTDLIKWADYRQKRNMTSHTYDETAAKEVMSVIPEFKNEAQYLLDRLKELV